MSGVSAVACDDIGWRLLVPEDRTIARSRCTLPVSSTSGCRSAQLWSHRLAARLRRGRVYEFLLVAPPLEHPGAMGSPLNPIALK